MKPIRFFALILFFGFTGLVLFYFYNHNPSQQNSFFVVCLTKLFFNVECLGCGGQRALHQLLQGNILSALQYNALFVVGLPFWAHVAYVFVRNQILSHGYQSPIFNHKYFARIFIAIVLLFMILRNLPWFPFTCLASS